MNKNLKKLLYEIDNGLYINTMCCYGTTGPTGSIGPTGPAGQTGPSGSTATIIVGTTTTGEPGSEAQVTNVGTSNSAILDFVIPQGQRGTTSIDSILVDNDGTQTVLPYSTLDLGDIINSTGTSITFSAPNTITLNEPGAYLMHFDFLASNTTTLGSLGASIQVNGVIAPNASEYVDGTTNELQFSLQHSLTINSPTTITVLNSSPVSSNYHDTSLSIIKLT